ncbi:MAG: cupin domain-containing protein [Filimonas sp.]|nr:cupin domain-containing protein [Filimonas sp.]
MDAQSLAAFYQLQPHPEGGYYRETYRSHLTLPANSLPADFNGERNSSTAIYFLLEQGNFSAFHRIKSDEVWHFYAGQALLVYVIHPEGWLEIIRLGNNIGNGEQFQAVVPAGCWFASMPAPATAFSFVGCTVAPGFDFHDFELAYADVLAKEYPQHESLIRQLCRQ